METGNSPTVTREPWNKGKLVRQKSPFKLKEIRAIRIRLQMASRFRELALFNSEAGDGFQEVIASERPFAACGKLYRGL